MKSCQQRRIESQTNEKTKRADLVPTDIARTHSHAHKFDSNRTRSIQRKKKNKTKEKWDVGALIDVEVRLRAESIRLGLIRSVQSFSFPWPFKTSTVRITSIHSKMFVVLGQRQTKIRNRMKDQIVLKEWRSNSEGEEEWTNLFVSPVLIALHAVTRIAKHFVVLACSVSTAC